MHLFIYFHCDDDAVFYFDFIWTLSEDIVFYFWLLERHECEPLLILVFHVGLYGYHAGQVFWMETFLWLGLPRVASYRPRIRIACEDHLFPWRLTLDDIVWFCQYGRTELKSHRLEVKQIWTDKTDLTHTPRNTTLHSAVGHSVDSHTVHIVVSHLGFIDSGLSVLCILI